jgi:hypothetical protein
MRNIVPSRHISLIARCQESTHQSDKCHRCIVYVAESKVISLWLFSSLLWMMPKVLLCLS